MGKEILLLGLAGDFQARDPPLIISLGLAKEVCHQERHKLGSVCEIYVGDL